MFSRSFEGSNYAARMSISKLLGMLLACTQESDRNKKHGMMGPVQPQNNKNSSSKTTTLEDALGLLSQGYLKGGVGSFLKGTGDLMKSGAVSPELRVGVSHAYVVMIKTLGPQYLERHLVTILRSVPSRTNELHKYNSREKRVSTLEILI